MGQVKFSIVIEGIHRLEGDVTSVRFIHHLETDDPLKITHGVHKSIPHVQKRVLKELLDGNAVFRL
jgi:hypothetical protein